LEDNAIRLENNPLKLPEIEGILVHQKLKLWKI